MIREQTLRRRIKLLTWLFIVGLILSGATAIPLQHELDLLARLFGFAGGSSEFAQWFFRVRDALAQTQSQYPFLFTARTGWHLDILSSRWCSSAHCGIPSATAGYSISA